MIKKFPSHAVICTPPCHEYAECTDIEGSPTCVCMAGFTGNGDSCTGMEGINTLLLHCSFDYVFLLLDINECDLNVCHEDANCTNTIGSFECQCRPGYSGDGIMTCSGERNH